MLVNFVSDSVIVGFTAGAGVLISVGQLRTGRRSTRAASIPHSRGYDNISVLDGGLVAWEAAGLLEAVELERVEL